MTRKLLSAAALMVAVFFTGSIAAEAADVTFGGQLRTRAEWWDEAAPGSGSSFIDMRVRLNTKAKIDDNISAFIQLQVNQRFGVRGGVFPPFISGPGDGNESSAEVGAHQAYFTIKNLFGLPLSFQPGRQEVVLDGHRLFGNTGWTMGSQTHDAVKFTHAHDNMTVAYVYSKAAENSSKGIAGQSFAGTDLGDNTDRDVHILWANMKDLVGAGSSTSGYLVFDDDDTAVISADIFTIGVRHAGSTGDIVYRFEGYYQAGKVVSGAERKAFLVAARVGYKMPSVAMKPKITLWLDYLSGDDPTSADDEQFDVLFDTGHKFYGFMDKFAGGGGPAGGLIDLAAKLALHPMAKLTFKADLHWFQFDEDQGAGDDVGQELDLTLKYKYAASTAFVLGFSHFLADGNFEGGEDSSWAYAMVNVGF